MYIVHITSFIAGIMFLLQTEECEKPNDDRLRLNTYSLSKINFMNKLVLCKTERL
jgi:hypothetical protein